MASLYRQKEPSYLGHIQVLYVYVLLCLLNIPGVYSKTYVLTPQVVNDTHGNQADQDSKITWAKLPVGDPYLTDTSYNDNGLQGLFDMARGFTSVIQPKDINYKEAYNAFQKFELSKIQSLLLDYQIGWAICFVIGFLFCLIMPFVGCCFCCCRLCGNCGGRMIQKNPKSPKRHVFSVAVFVCLSILLSGAICSYVNNGRFLSTLDEVNSRVNTSLGDINRFLNNTVNQIKFVAEKDFGFTKEVIKRDLDNIDVLVGVPVRQQLDESSNISKAIDGIIGLDSDINKLSEKVVATNKSLNNLKDASLALAKVLQEETNKINKTLTTCSTACTLDISELKIDFNFDRLDDITSNIESMSNVKSQNITALALEGKKEFDQIPDRVKNETNSIVNDIKDKLDDFDKEIKNKLKQVTDLPQKTSGTAGVEQDVQDLTDIVLKYDNYVSNSLLGLTSIVFLVVLLMILGLGCGCLFSKADNEPTHRSSASTWGARFLLAAVGFMFIFSWLLMILVMLMFIVGGQLERNVCQPIRDRSLFNQFLDGPNGIITKNGYPLGELLLQNKSIDLTFDGILRDCSQNKAAYSAVKLGSLFNLNEITDYKKEINLTAQIAKIQTDFSDVKILTNDTRKQLKDFLNGLNINFSSLISELEKNTTKVSLTSFAMKLYNLSSSLPPLTNVSRDLNASAGNLIYIEDNQVKAVAIAQKALATSIRELESESANIPKTVKETIQKVETAESKLKQNGPGLVKTEAQNYGKRIINSADQFVTKANSSIQNDVGKCKPISDIWESLVDILLCSQIIDTINGFWFSLGMCLFFFIPSIIFNVKLSKYFRRMDEEEVYEGGNNDKGEYNDGYQDTEMSHMSQNDRQSSVYTSLSHRGNKVGQS